MSKHKVLIGSPAFGMGRADIMERLEQAGCAVIPNRMGRCYTEEELIERIPGVAALISGLEPVTARVLGTADQLKVIARYGVGVDNVDLAAADLKGIVVAVSKGTHHIPVAELALGLMLSIARQIPQSAAEVTQGRWERRLGTDLSGKVLGIVGLGLIGKEVCRRAKAFDMKVIATDVFQDTAFAEEWGVSFVELDELLSQADFITLHAPLLPSTQRLIGAAELARMKPTAFLINTARGALVDEEALAQALRNGGLAGAASDVFAQEPPGQHPLLELDNFIAMPHVGGYTLEALQRVDGVTAENVIRVLQGRWAVYEARL